MITPSPAAAQTATLGSWQSTEPYPNRSHPVASFAIGNYYYVLREGLQISNLYYAKQGANGLLVHPTNGATSGIWRDISPAGYGASPHGHTAISVGGTAYFFRNGHVVRFNQNTTDGSITNIVDMDLPDKGAFYGYNFVWDSAVLADFGTDQYFVHFGGYNFAGGSYPVGYKQNMSIKKLPFADNNARNTGNSFSPAPINSPTSQPGKAVFYRPAGQNYGYIFLGRGNGHELWRIQINQDGTFSGGWNQLTSLPAGNGNGRGDLFIIGNTIFAIKGSKVYSADVNNQGSLTSWGDSPPDLPAEQINMHWGGGNTEGASYGIIGNYVYVTGGDRVFYSQIGGVVLPTATPIGQPPTATPTPGGATNTPVPPTPTSGIPNTPIPPACTPGVCTEALKQSGDYNCDCVVDARDYTDAPEYTSWVTDYISQAWNISLRYFEYWRRAFFSGGGVLPPLPTPDPSCTVLFQWDQSKGGLVRTATADPTKDNLGLFWTSVSGASYHVKVVDSTGWAFYDAPAPPPLGINFQSEVDPAETYTITVTWVGTCAVLYDRSYPIGSVTPTPAPGLPTNTPIPGLPTNTPIPGATATPTPIGAPIATPTPTIDPAVSCNGLGNIGGTYGDLPVSGSDGRRADIHADKNLAVRGWVPTITTLGLVDLSGPVDPAQPPQLYRLFGDNRTPQFTNNYKVYDWDWNVQPDGARGSPLSLYDSTLIGMGVTRGERIFVPDSAYQLTGGYEVVVHYVDQDSISMHYRERDTVSGNGYTIHIDGVCIDQNLITKYNSLGGNNGTRTRLPALQAGQAFGEAGGTEIRAAIVDTGEFQDPRSRKDWWQGR